MGNPNSERTGACILVEFSRSWQEKRHSVVSISDSHPKNTNKLLQPPQ